MTDAVDIHRGAYHDSVTLMQVSRQVRDTEGVEYALIGMGTQLNLDLIVDSGFEVPAETGADDLVVALRGADDAAIQAGRAAFEAAVAELRTASRSGGSGSGSDVAPHTVGSAGRRGEASLAVVSTPGRVAALDARDAIEAGLSVMLFSDNVSVEDEIALKDAAAERDVLVMGPDCGTAIVGGVALGFANATRPGRFGLIAASGTGAQHVMCLLDQAGEGISHCLGLGGRDLSDRVDARSARQALAALAADEATEHVIVVSKPAPEHVVASLKSMADDLGVAVSWATLGRGQVDLTEAVENALAAAGAVVPEWPVWAGGSGDRATGPGGSLRGLYCGGTLADEAMLIAERALGPIASNIPLDGSPHADPARGLDGHVVVDFGDDQLTQGRPHPMIDPSLRLESIREQAADPATSVLLLDLVLGYGAHPDPAPELADAIREARETAAGDGRDLTVVVAIIGTDSDPQGLQRSAQLLADAGAQIDTSHARAVRSALAALGAEGTTPTNPDTTTSTDTTSTHTTGTDTTGTAATTTGDQR